MTTTTEPETSIQPEPAPKPRSLRRRVMSRISIQSKLLVMLLVTSILSAAVVGAIGYQSGRSSLRASVFDRLTEIRRRRVGSCRVEVRRPQEFPGHLYAGSTATEAIEAFTTGFDQLGAPPSTRPSSSRSSTTTPRQFAKPEEDRRATGRRRCAAADGESRRSICRRLYTAPFDDWDKAIKFDDARDGSAWSAANARFNDFFREIVKRFRVRGRAAPRHPGQCRLQRIQGRRSRHQRPHRPLQGWPAYAPPTRRLWIPTPSTTSGSPISATINPPTSRPHGSCRRSGRRAAWKAYWHCSFRSPRSTG